MSHRVPSGPSAPTRATPKWLTALAMLLVLVVVLSAFALSFTVLRDLAALAGIPSDVAWLWPVIVDGTITAATLVHYTGRATGRRQLMPLATLILFGGASIVGNVAHILMVDPSSIVPAAIAVFVGIVPPVGLILTVEILGGLLRAEPRREPVVEQVVSTAHEPVQADQPGEPVAHNVSHVFDREAQPVVDAEVEQAIEQPVVQVPSTPDRSDGPLERRESLPCETPNGLSNEPLVDQPVTDPEPMVHAVEPVAQTEATEAEPVLDRQSRIVAQARELIDGGQSVRATADQLDVSRATLSRWLKAADETPAEDEPLAQIAQLHVVGR